MQTMSSDLKGRTRLEHMKLTICSLPVHTTGVIWGYIGYSTLKLDGYLESQELTVDLGNQALFERLVKSQSPEPPF